MMCDMKRSESTAGKIYLIKTSAWDDQWKTVPTLAAIDFIYSQSQKATF